MRPQKALVTDFDGTISEDHGNSIWTDSSAILMP